METKAICTNLIARLEDLRSSKADERVISKANELVTGYRARQITEQDLIRSGQELLRVIGGSDNNRALERKAALFAPRGISLPENTYAKIFNASDRGVAVTAVENAIRAGEINPIEVLNA